MDTPEQRAAMRAATAKRIAADCARLANEARASGLTTLAYLLDVAKIEAEQFIVRQ